MSLPSRTLRMAIGGGLSLVALAFVLLSTGPDPEVEIGLTVRREGGPCLRLEQWGLFGWVVVGHTSTMTEATHGVWGDNPAKCTDLPDSVILVRLPADASTGVYRICGQADEQPCTTVQRVPGFTPVSDDDGAGG